MYFVITEGISLYLFGLWIKKISKYVSRVNKDLGMMMSGLKKLFVFNIFGRIL